MTNDIITVLFISSITVILLVLMSIYLFYVFYSNKSKLEQEKAYLESEVSRSQLEIREDFMRNVGKELHDNVGQLLSTAKLQLSMSDHKEEYADSIGLIAQSLTDIRNLSKVVDPDVINNMGLVESCKLEMDRLNRLPHISTKFEVTGNPFDLKAQSGIILFRILQESFNNSFKHSQSEKIDLSLHFDKPTIIINLRDYGVGFDKSLMNSSGSGLLNMKKRAAMIGASYKIESVVGKGTQIKITYEQHPYHEHDPNRNS